MKRLLFLLLTLVSSVAFGQQRYVYSRATPGGSSSYQQLLEADVPSNFLRSNATNTLTGDLVLTGAHVVTIGHPISGTLTGINAYVTGKGFTINASGIDLVPGGTFNNGYLLWKTGGVLAGFAPGSANQILASNGTVPGWISNIPVVNFNGGTGASSSTFWRGDGTWATPASGSTDWGDLTNVPTPITTLEGLGPAGYKVQVNALGTDYEFAPQSVDPGTTVADLLYLGSIAPNAYARLGIGTTGQVLTVSAGGLPSWVTPGTISDGDKGDITVSASGATWTIDNAAVTYAKIQNGTALSVFGRSANSSGVNADITAANDFEILRRSGTAIGFGSINLASSAAVGSSILPLANGGTGSATALWRALTGTSTMTGNVTDAFGTNTFTSTSTAVGLAYTRNSAFTSNADNQGSWRINGTITGGATINRRHWSMQLGQGLTTGSTGQSFSALQTIPTLTASHTGAMVIGFDWDATIGGAQAASALNIPILIRDTDASIRTAGNMFIGGIGTTPTGQLHIAAGTTAASSGPIKLTEGSNPTSAEDGIVNYVSNNLTFTETSTVYTLAKTLTATATLDFGSTAAGTSTDLTITVTGAADGDPVVVGVPAASVPDAGAFTAWVSATNTVTVRFSNNALVAAKDPASGTFRASVIHY